MTFVPIGGQTGYVMFASAPEGRAAVALTDKGMVRLLGAGPGRGEWQVLREWPVAAYSHTDLMISLAHEPEPDSAEKLLNLLPAQTLG